jgi:hypothetical protein
VAVAGVLARGLGIRLLTKPKDIEQVAKKAQKEIKKDIPRAILRTGLLGQQIIKQRTAKGVGFGGGFKGYSPQYMAALSKQGKPTSPVDLFNTGQMLRSMQVRRRDNRTAELYFDNKQAAEKAAMNNKTRPFFGFNRKEELRLGEYFRKQL